MVCTIAEALAELVDARPRLEVVLHSGRLNMTELVVLTVQQCAEVLQCSPELITGFIHAGELKRIELTPREAGVRRRGPSGWRILRKDLEAFIASRSGYETPKAEAPLPVPEPRVFLPVACGTDGKDRLARRRPQLMPPAATGTDGKSRLRRPKKAM